MSKKLTLVAFFLLVLGLWGSIGAKQITQKAKLEELSRQWRAELEAKRTPLYYELLKSDALPQRKLNEDPNIQLMYIDERERPVFFQVHNLYAAMTISTDDVWPGGSGGFSLSGSETVVGQLGLWDAGSVFEPHPELAGRVVQIDSPAAYHFHSTHVAGTMIATGLDEKAKGMSFEGRLAAYDWNYELSEMATAASSGMNISNHSYGIMTGWNFST
ncbi:MAG: hypothetical protein OEV55_01925 [candidate division Zixibacteria bacterium]|nr:hypothetical protein [candidate division Zixibacteria bacterium]